VTLRRITLTVALAAAALAILPAAGQARRAPYHFRTVPPLSHVKVTVLGKIHYTNSKGRFTIKLPSVGTKEIPDAVKPASKRLSDGHIAKFDRWYGPEVMTYDDLYRMKFDFRDLGDKLVDPHLVNEMTLKSRTGVRTTVKQGQSVWLQASRVVPFTGELVSKDIDYQVESAFVDGTNVVNRAQQRFAPRKGQQLSVQLLFYSLKVVTKDALLGFPVGSAVDLKYPSGRTVRHPLKDGQVVLPSLPRGTYNLKVAASGISFTRPVSVSRNQQVELKVISYLDIILAFAAMVSIAIGLLLARRPDLRRKLRRRRRQTVGAGRA
jgi:hypothetical protein